MNCVWSLGKNDVSDKQFVSFSQPPLVTLLKQPVKVLEEEEGEAATSPPHLDRPTSRDRHCQGGSRRPVEQSVLRELAPSRMGKNRKAIALTTDISELPGIGNYK